MIERNFRNQFVSLAQCASRLFLLSEPPLSHGKSRRSLGLRESVGTLQGLLGPFYGLCKMVFTIFRKGLARLKIAESAVVNPQRHSSGCQLFDQFLIGPGIRQYQATIRYSLRN